jgi:hypothetical protein
MAPVPPESVLRLRVTQTGPRGTHRMLFHARIGVTLSTLIGAVTNILNEMKDLCYSGTSFASADYATAGVKFFTPVSSWVPIDAPNTFLPTASDPTGTYACFVGRSFATGVRKRLFLYNFAFNLRQDMRYELGEETAVDQAIGELVANQDFTGAIDGTAVAWKTYINVGVNDYWTRRDRVNS